MSEPVLTPVFSRHAMERLAYRLPGWEPAAVLAGCRPISATKARRWLGGQTLYGPGPFFRHRPSGAVLVCGPGGGSRPLVVTVLLPYAQNRIAEAARA